ncbi:uncharacterized protein [Venturia canescens]|uniref:uncharacterized protein n=1 Tax=Venturia canescens TaxID=32260 RepID=UPI001C9CFCA1|nr:uncharacterized protein LOC122413203 [Venturia canescens]
MRSDFRGVASKRSPERKRKSQAKISGDRRLIDGHYTHEGHIVGDRPHHILVGFDGGPALDKYVSQQAASFRGQSCRRYPRETDGAEWRHVRSKDNPADLISRGLLPNEFMDRLDWKFGPVWLSEDVNSWPKSELTVPSDIPEMRKAQCFLTATIDKGQLCPKELSVANEKIIKLVQESVFYEEVKELKKGRSLPHSHKLKGLAPFVDDSGLLRVGGRLKNAPIPYSQKHPILIPKGHHITTLLIRNEHRTNYHAGAQTTLYALRRQYWLIDTRNQVRKAVKQCTTCVRAAPPVSDYVMGDLPKSRVWVAVFVCLVVKTVHLEVVSDLTTEGFIAVLKRFVARRGKPGIIRSDNGRYLANEGIEWYFTPPLSPHFGGLWEAGVTSFKHHLKRVCDDLVRFEEFNTLIIEIEAILNSRPLTPISTDPNDLIVLTLGHFLIGDFLTSLPEKNFQATPSNRISLWQLVQKKTQEFWRRWHKEYLNELNIRNKWTDGSHDIKEGTVVILQEDNSPPRHWPLGRIVQVIPGNDGIIRVVKVKTATGEFRRNIRKISPLLNDIDDQRKDIVELRPSQRGERVAYHAVKI